MLDVMHLALLLAILLGITLGSFLNVVILRHEASKTVTGRSVCPRCGKQLTWRELVPILSYLLQRGRCQGCGAPISIQYPLVELCTGIMFVMVYVHVAGAPTLGAHSFAVLLELVLHLAIWSTLIVITVYDLRTKLIPDVFSFTFSGLALALLLLTTLTTGQSPLITLASGPLFYLPYWLLWKVSDGRWIGLGDAKLSWGIGWFLGLSMGGSAILLAFWIGAAVSLALIGVARLRSRFSIGASRLTLKSEVPFGPFLVLGTLIVYCYDFDLFAWLVGVA